MRGANSKFHQTRRLKSSKKAYLFKLRPSLREKQNLLVHRLPCLGFIAQLDDFNHHLPCTSHIGSETHLLLFIQQGLDLRIELAVLLQHSTISISIHYLRNPTEDFQSVQTEPPNRTRIGSLKSTCDTDCVAWGGINVP